MDGTHIDVIIPEEDQLRHRGRKGTPTINVLAICDFDLLFTYVLSGWEGSAHDSRIFLDAIGDTSLNFPHPLPGNFIFSGYMCNYLFSKLNLFIKPFILSYFSMLREILLSRQRISRKTRLFNTLP